MRIRKLTSLSTAALIHFFCGLYQSEAFVNTIISSSSKKTRQQQQQQYIIISDDFIELNAYFGSNGGGDVRYSNSNSNSNDRQNNNNNNHHHYNRRRKFDRKPRNDNYYSDNNYNNNEQSARDDDQRKEWLQKATDDILEKNEPGTLTKGKWHELVSMMKGWSKLSKVDSNSPIVIERLIKRIHDEIKYGNEEAKIDIHMYNWLLDAWCCVALFPTNYNNQNQNQNNQQSTSTITPSPSVASQRAREILVLLQENFDSESTKRRQQQQNSNTNTNTTAEEEVQQSNSINNNNIIQPNEESFAMVFDVVLKVEGISAARRLLAWMEYTSKMMNNNNSNAAKPIIRKFYIRILNAYANSRDVKAGILAEGLLRHMNKIGEIPNTVCYNIAIKAWTKAKRGRESAEHADRILDEMQAPKDVITYSTVISAWSASGMRSHAVVRAEELLREIENTPNLEPNNFVLNSIMSTWVKSHVDGTVNRTTELLEYMEYSKHAPADLFSYNTHLHALSIHSHNDREYAQRADDILASLERRYEIGEISFRPNVFSYNVVIDAWGKSQDPEGAWNAAKLLRRFISNDSKFEPDTFSFNQVFSALSRSKKTGSTQLAEHLLSYMEIAYSNRNLRNAKADVVSYTSVIISLARSGESDSAERGERLLKRLKEQYESGKTYLKPTRIVYNALIDAWAKSGSVLGARKAEALLKEMDEMCAMGDPSIAPNVVTYNAVMNSWARSGTRCCGNMAEKYLDRMIYLNGTKGEIKPNEFTYNTVINAIAKSQSATKTQKSLRILRRMDKLYQSGYKQARPNILTYTSVLNAAAFPAKQSDFKTKRKALDTAIFTLHELQSSQYGHPTELTYSTFMKACSNLLSSKDETSLREVIEETFHQCKKDGQVGEMFLSRLKEAAPKDLYTSLLSDVVTDRDFVKVDDLPQSWRCNVRN